MHPYKRRHREIISLFNVQFHFPYIARNHNTLPLCQNRVWLKQKELKEIKVRLRVTYQVGKITCSLAPPDKRGDFNTSHLRYTTVSTIHQNAMVHKKMVSIVEEMLNTRLNFFALKWLITPSAIISKSTS